MAESNLDKAKNLLQEANTIVFGMKEKNQSLNIISLGLRIEEAIGNIDKVRHDQSTNPTRELSTAIINLKDCLIDICDVTTSESKTNLVEKINESIKLIKPTQGGKRKPLVSCTVSELKAKAKKRGINVTGLKKTEIIAKLRRR